MDIWICLETGADKSRFYEDAGFITSGKMNKNGNMRMHKRIYQRTFERSASDRFQVTDHMNVRLI